jgi:hypothetical protein
LFGIPKQQLLASPKVRRSVSLTGRFSLPSPSQASFHFFLFADRANVAVCFCRRFLIDLGCNQLKGKQMFREQAGDDQQAELFAMGLIKEPKNFGTLALVPCKHKLWCKTHGTMRIKMRMKLRQLKRKVAI